MRKGSGEGGEKRGRGREKPVRGEERGKWSEGEKNEARERGVEEGRKW